MEDRERLVRALATAGVVAPAEEADALLDAAGAGSVDELVARRLDGEPLAWIVGWTPFLGLRITVDRGVFVPRPHTELLARRAVDLLPADGVAVDLCTGCGAIAAGVDAARPDARVLATDDDPIAVACARRNGVDAMLGDLDEPLPHDLRGRVDVLSAVVPYVPTEELHLLPEGRRRVRAPTRAGRWAGRHDAPPARRRAVAAVAPSRRQPPARARRRPGRRRR